MDGTVEAVVAIARVLDGGAPGFGDDLRQLFTPPAEPRPEHRQSVDLRVRRNPGQSGEAATELPGTQAVLRAAARGTAPHGNCGVELFQGAGHFPHLDDPARFAALVRDFVSAST